MSHKSASSKPLKFFQKIPKKGCVVEESGAQLQRCVEGEHVATVRLYSSHNLKLDAKGRIFIPAKQRDAFREGVLLTVWQGPSLLLMPAQYWEMWENEVFARLPIGAPDDYTKLKRTLYGNMSMQELDKAGRVIISPRLQTYAHINSDVVLIGYGYYYELWAAEEWEKYNVLEEIDEFFKSVKALFGPLEPTNGTDAKR